MDIRKMIDDYAAWLRTEITTATFGEYEELTTPYLDRFNDYLQIYVKKNDDGTISMTDDGYVIGSLITSGMTFKKGSNRHKMLNRIAVNYGVSITNEDITTVATAHNFPQKKHMMIQAMLAIDDLYIASPESVKDFFLEDIETYFASNDIICTKDFSLIGKTGTIYTYDFHFQRTRNRGERFCKGFNKLNLSKRDLTLFNWIDTQDKRGESGELIVLYNDTSSVSDEIITGFTNWGVKTVPFSHRQESQYLELFAS